SEQVRRDDARALLDLIAVALESGDETAFIQFAQTQVDAQVQQGFKIESLSEALTHLQETLMPLVVSVESAKFLWRVFSQIRTVMSIQTHKELRASEKQFRELADNASAGIFIHRDGIVQFASREAFRALGYDSLEQVVGRSIIDFIVEDERERVAAIIRRRLAGEPVSNQYEARLLKKDGASADVLMSGALIEYEGQTAIQGTFVDISERVQVNKELYQQSALLRGVAEAAEQLLTIPDPSVAINQALAILGVAMDVDRVYIFENHPHSETGEPAMSQRFEWARA
ncbi:MAG: PAS domain S-box protein, partial [Deltaproteobacteria bacterium]|nr:PAS domain S-box protein [Deltaproteobacteria bacterium]